MQKLVFLTGAGISAESGLKTFRDAGGLWEGHKIEDVASPEGFARNPGRVLDFYNQRRRQLRETSPNDAHLTITRLQDHFDTVVITQNVDDLHERAGNSRVIHLHGELTRACSSKRRELSGYIGYRDILPGETAPDGSQLRPDIVWFGESVPMMETAAAEVMSADVLVIVGTSLEVYPAAGLIHYTAKGCEIFIIDPNRHENLSDAGIYVIREKAVQGMKKLYRILVPDEI